MMFFLLSDAANLTTGRGRAAGNAGRGGRGRGGGTFDSAIVCVFSFLFKS